MATWPREYPIMELCLNTRNMAQLASGNERSVEGDIVVIRRPHTHIGKLEGLRRIWLLVEGFSIREFEVLTQRLQENGVKYDKRRFCIPFARLKRMAPFFDIDKARDNTILYQPFMCIDEDGPYWYLHGSCRKPLEAHGLIFDRLTQRYL